METEQNKTLIRRLYAECFTADPDRIDEFFDDEYVHHSDRWKNREERDIILHDLHRVYTEIRYTIDLIMAEDDKVAVISRTVCTPENTPVEDIMAAMIYRIQNGKITDSWGYSNSFF